MNKKVSKKEIILELYEAGKSVNEIQFIVNALFKNDQFASIQVYFFFY